MPATAHNETPVTGPTTPERGVKRATGQLGALESILLNPALFSEKLMGTFALRAYQSRPVMATAAAVAEAGHQLAWVYSRQSGKDESLAQLLAWILVRYQRKGGQCVVAAPTLEQARITRERLTTRLEPLGLGEWTRSDTVGIGRASVAFVSASKEANVRGKTASLLLVANEAQDIDPARWDAVFDPMAASTNATTLYMGTVWDGQGLLSRQMKWLRTLEERDGRQRLFLVPWREVERELPAYGQRVRDRIEQLGPEHPFIRTEYELIELEGATGLFGPERRERMKGGHARQTAGKPRTVYAMTVDVAGAEEASRLAGQEWDPDAARDSTVATIFEVDVPKRNAAGAGALPVYRAVHRRAWTGADQVQLARDLVTLARSWGMTAAAVDATGLGAGLAAVLADELDKGPRRCAVYPFVFSQASKSVLGWEFVGLIDSGRYQEYRDDGAADTAAFWRETERCVYEVLEGPGKLLRWGHRPGEHDDFVISAALVTVLDEHDWRTRIARGTKGEGSRS